MFLLPTVQYGKAHPEMAFPDPDNTLPFTFVATYNRSKPDAHEELLDPTDRNCFAIVFQLKDPNSTENEQTMRRLAGTYVAAQLTLHAKKQDRPIPMLGTVKGYTYPKNFTYVGDDPLYGVGLKPLGKYLMPKDAINLYLKTFNEDISVQELTENDDAMNELFGDASDETKEMVLQHGEDNQFYNPDN
jgi:hypothetical protein